MSGDEEDTGTGWPDAGTTKHLPARTDGNDAAEPSGKSETVHVVQIERERKGFFARWFGRLAFLGITALVVVLILLVTNLTGFWHFSNPFAAQKKDRSQPTLLLSIKDLARFEAASGNFQVIIDVQEDHKYIPDIIFSRRSLFVAAGSVDAYVDFSNIAKDDIQASADHKTVTVHLPAPGLEPPTLDVSNSYVYAEQEGIVNHIGDLFNNDPNKQQELYQLAQQKIATAAAASGLTDRAATNTKEMLTQLLKSLGYTNIDIEFPST